jgi:hypothetical protein
MNKLRERLIRTKQFRKEEVREKSTIGDPLQQPATELKIPNAPSHGLRIAVVTDAQVSPGVPTNHLVAAGKYIAAKQPDVIVCIGDFWDMPSLSEWDKPGSISTEGRRYRADIDAGCDAMEQFLNPIAKVAGYSPVQVFTMGNHEYRGERAIRNDPARLDGVISRKDFKLERYGWKVFPFLQPVVIADVAFCHFFPSGVMGRPVITARALLSKLHMSAFAGHQQGRQIAYDKRADGREITAIISGSFYQHNEEYLSPFTNKHWRGMYFLNEVKDGSFDEMALSLNYLLRRFG